MRAVRIARRERLLFLHIPKTAGTSMRHYLHTQYRREEILPATNWEQCVAKGLDPAEYALFAGHFRFSFRSVVPAGTRSMVIMRDPVARYISHLRHAHAAPDFDLHHDSIKNLTLADIIRHPQYGPLWSNGQTKWIASRANPDAAARQPEPHPGNDRVNLDADDDETERLARAKRHLEEIDVIGFAEDMDRLAGELCALLKFHPPSRFPLKNVGVNAAFAGQVSAEDRAVIAGLNEEDRELCAHARQLNETRRLHRRVVALAASDQYDVPELPFMLDLKEPIPGSGWHHAESAGASTWRWTDADTVASLQFARTFPPGTVGTVCFFDWAAPAHPKLELTVNGAPRAFSLGQRDGFHELRFVLSHDAATNFYDIAVRTLWPKPEKPKMADQRDLGIAVFSIAFAQGGA